MFDYFKNNKLFLTSALLSTLCFCSLASVAQARPIDKTFKPKKSSLKLQKNLSLDVHLTLSRSFAHKHRSTNNSTKFELQNPLELSEIEQTIPVPDRFEIANAFSGKASWYGPGFHGRRTASGEIFNQNALTAAHRNLRFGTRVKVTNLINGRSITVRINDRGPYSKSRVIDLSAAAARSLGLIKSGVAPVKVTVLGR